MVNVPSRAESQAESDLKRTGIRLKLAKKPGVDLRQSAVLFSSRSTHQLSSKARVRNQCSSALPSGQPSRSDSA